MTTGRCYIYDVFLSFRGPKTHKIFIDVLHSNFIDVEVWVFRDKEELSFGQRIREREPRDTRRLEVLDLRFFF